MPNVVLPAGNNTYTPTPQDADYTITQIPPSNGNNTISLGNGADQVTFADGNNTLTLLDGADQVFLGNGGNTVTTGNGNDQVVVGNGNLNVLTTGNGNSQVTVGNGNDTITVGTGSNTIVLGTGLDTVSTKAGNDTVSVAGSAVTGDTIHGALSTLDGSTNQLVMTSPGAAMSPVNVYGFQSYQLANGGPNSLTLANANFTNLPQGSISIAGGNSGNTVNGAALSAAHSVVIKGGAGVDMLTGGAGNDRFIFAPSDLSADTVSGGGGANTLELTAGSGAGMVNGLGGTNFSGLAVVDIDAGANWLFTSTAAVTDTINLASGAIGEFSGGVSSGQTIAFGAALGTLKIDSVTQFAGQIAGLQMGDTIDLTAIPFDSGGSTSLAAGNALRVMENGQTYTLQLDPNQNFAGQQFQLSQDSGNGTQIALMPVSSPVQSEIIGFYQTILGRTPSASEVNVWEQVLAGGATLAQVRTDFATTPETQNNIANLYQTILGRPASASDVNVWEQVLAGGASLAQVRTDLSTTAETQNNIANLYQTILGRPASASDVNVWEQVLVGGASLAQVRTDLSTTPETQNHIANLYQSILERPASASDVNVWEQVLASGASLAQVRTDLSTTAETQNHIVGLYQSILGRTPSASEVNVWGQVLAAGAGLAQVRVDFATTPEAQNDLSGIFQSVEGRSPDQAELAGLENQIAVPGATQNSVATALANNGPTGFTIVVPPPGSVSLNALAGPEEFDFSAGNFGNDTVVGFNDASDAIRLSHTLAPNFATIQADAHAVGGNTVISLDATHSIQLTGINPSSLVAANFHIV